MRASICFAFVLLAAPASGVSQQTVVKLDPAQTHIDWTLGASLHTVHGTFNLKRGLVRFNGATGEASGEIVIDLASGQSGNHDRDAKMHKDILQTQRYPEAVFLPDRVEGPLNPGGESHPRVHGVLKFHGAEHELWVDSMVKADGSHLTGSVRLEIPYVAWGLKNPSTFLLHVSDHVKMEIQASAVATPGG